MLTDSSHLPTALVVIASLFFVLSLGFLGLSLRAHLRYVRDKFLASLDHETSPSSRDSCPLSRKHGRRD